jgi:hypothetical protein
MAKRAHKKPTKAQHHRLKGRGVLDDLKKRWDPDNMKKSWGEMKDNVGDTLKKAFGGSKKKKHKKRS